MKKVGFFRSIQLKFIIIYILLLVIAVQVIGSYVARELEAELLDNFKESANDRIDLLSYNVEQAFNKQRTDDPEEPTLQEEIQDITSDVDQLNATIQIMNNQGRVLGTNDYLNTEVIGKKITEETVERAIKFNTSIDNTSLNAHTGERVLVRVEPIVDSNNNVQGAIYLETSLENVYSQLQKINEIFFKGSVIALIVSVLLGILVARAITKPILEMRQQAQTMARGDFSQKVKVYGSDEISQLAITFNHLNDRLKHYMGQIENEQRKLESVLENMTDGVIAADSKGKITLMNEAAGRLFNENPMQLLNKELLTVLELEERVEDIIELQESDSLVLDYSRGDDMRYVKASFSTLYDDSKSHEATGVITVLSDVTEQEQIEQERREFVSNVSHELRTPLTTMKSYLEALMDGAWEDPEIAPRFLEVTQNETERMIRMVNSLLQLSKIDSNEQPLMRETVDFPTFFHHIIDRFEMNTKDGKITFIREIPDESFPVFIDKDKMTQVLDNIISNAVKYSPDGGRITCKITKHIRQIVVSVSDEGIGIEYEKLDKIFDRFYRVDRARTRQLGGTGLGLAITRELVESHYGKIWATSKEGKGTTIHFTLPLNNKRRGQQ